jgi:hypothetical protein
VAQAIDVRAEMEGKDKRILGELKSAWPPRARGVVASSPHHKMPGRRAMLGDGNAG